MVAVQLNLSYPDSVVLEGVCDLELSITQKCVENTIFTSMPRLLPHPRFEFNRKNGSKGHQVERGVRNLDDRIREVRA